MLGAIAGDIIGSVYAGTSDVESAIRLVISLGGDSDTMACIAGGMAQAFYGQVPADIETEVRARLPEDLLGVVDRFNQKLPTISNALVTA